MSKFESFLSKNRKLKLTLLYFFVVTILLVLGKIDPAGYLDFLKWSLGLFAGANAIQKIGRKQNIVSINKTGEKNEQPDKAFLL